MLAIELAALAFQACHEGSVPFARSNPKSQVIGTIGPAWLKIMKPWRLGVPVACRSGTPDLLLCGHQRLPEGRGDRRIEVAGGMLVDERRAGTSVPHPLH